MLSFFGFHSGIVFIQLAVSIAWLIYDPPDVREVYPSPLQAVLTCKGSGHSLMISLILIIFLVPLCTIYAFKTRKIPENFNEAKYIGFTMYSTCIVFLASIAIYFGTSTDYKIQVRKITAVSWGHCGNKGFSFSYSRRVCVCASTLVRRWCWHVCLRLKCISFCSNLIKMCGRETVDATSSRVQAEAAEWGREWVDVKWWVPCGCRNNNKRKAFSTLKLPDNQTKSAFVPFAV